ncbi:MAG: glycerol-3-phosphate 1-O-acyltransferase [Dehalococcoidia bacterium]|nr:glycerol-3-phosphate 1-O-acyltransferase [Dehalococcoidia bacterium]
MPAPLALPLAALGGYLLGSIPTGLLVARRRGIDLREYGSGKTGFTNTLRTLGVGPALVTVAVDIGKGALAVVLARTLFDDPWATALAGLCAVAGHNWTLFAGFRGGRGVATTFGAFLAMSPLAALAVFAAAGAVLATTRYVSLMSTVGVLSGFVVLAVLVTERAPAGLRLPAEYLLFGVLVTLLVELSHAENIRRLLAGTEPKLGQGGGRHRRSGA